MEVIHSAGGLRLAIASLFLHRKSFFTGGYSSKLAVCFQRHPSLVRPITTKPKTKTKTPSSSKKQHSFTVDYLVNSCGLSSEAAVTASLKMQLQSPGKPDSVLQLLKERGFSRSQISTLIRKRPFLLLAHPVNTLSPKLDFFISIGLSDADLARTLVGDPTLLTRSLENQLIPSYNSLKTILLSDDKIVTALKRTTWVFLKNHSHGLTPNVDLMTKMGVPQSCISLLLTHFPEAAMQRHADFCKAAKEVEEMGFDPTKSTFVMAVHAISGESHKSIWKRCFKVYRDWGWSEDDVLAAFRRHPHCMILSEKKINRGMDFFVNKMGCSPWRISQSPVVLFFSLEKRLIPRYKVFQVLVSKGLVKEDLSLSTLFIPVEKYFLKRFVLKFEKEVPELLGIYEGKLNPPDESLSFGSRDDDNVK